MFITQNIWFVEMLNYFKMTSEKHKFLTTERLGHRKENRQTQFKKQENTYTVARKFWINNMTKMVAYE